MNMLAAILDTHVKDIGKAVCGSSSQSLIQKATSDMKFTVQKGKMTSDKFVDSTWTVLITIPSRGMNFS